VSVNALVADAISARRRIGVRRALTGLLATAVVVGVWFAAWPASTVTGRLHVALLQGNDKDRDLTQAELDARYLPASHFALAARLSGRYDLVVFPESSLDDDPRHDPWLASHVQAVARRLHSYVLVNAVADADPRGDRALNLDVLYSPSGRVVGTYAKRHLVPYGEYVPGRAVLTHVISALDQIPRDFAPGHTPGLFVLHDTSDGRSPRIATLICFESAFGYQVRPLVRDGAQLIVVSTNNRSYRRSANSSQHVEVGQMRAAETGRVVLQAAISGHTAIIDARGRVLTHTPLFRNGVVSATVETRTGLTPYVRFGDWAFGASLLVVLGAVMAGAMARVGGGKRESEEEASVDSPGELVRGAV
jgi:apolipoprotein N-acyltransferase